MMRKIIAGLAISVILSGCASLKIGNTELGKPGDPVDTIRQLTIADLNEALVDARAHNDQVAADCWNVLLGLSSSLAGRPPIELKGAASAFQAARDLARTGAGQNEILSEINRGCAALFVDANATLLRLGVIVAPK